MSTHPRLCHRIGGFSLIEVMVALIVVSIGMLGLAKMESLALSSADVSGTRTIAAVEAASLAAMMHADHDYWGSASAPGAAVTVTSTGSTVNVTGNATLAATGNNCVVPGATACNVSQMAAYDVQNWGATLQNLLPGYTATILCTPTSLVAATPSPVTCTITINWVENAVAVSALQSNLAGLATPTYTLNVEP